MNYLPNTDTTIATICNGNQYDFYDSTYTNAGTYYIQTNINDIDSLHILILSVSTSYNNDTINVTICNNETYEFGGKGYNSAGIYMDSLASINGCDSVVTLNLKINPTYNDTINITICDNETYEFGGKTYNSAGIYLDSLASINGCDSVVTLNLKINPTYNDTINITICDNETYEFGGKSYNSAGTYIDSLASINGCDSIITLNLKVNPTYNDTINVTICDNETYKFGGKSYNSAGIYMDSLASINGCDSVVTLNLKVNPTYNDTINVTICDNETYEFGGKSYNSAGIYTDSLSSINGCDSVVTLILNVNPTYNDSLTVKVQKDSTYIYKGNAYGVGEYTVELQTIDGCDSIIYLTVVEDNALTDINKNILVKIYPNPTQTTTTISVEGLTEDVEIKILDVQSRLIKKYLLRKGEKNLNLNVSDLSKDVYNIIISGKHTNISKKLIVK